MQRHRQTPADLQLDQRANPRGPLEHEPLQGAQGRGHADHKRSQVRRQRLLQVHRREPGGQGREHRQDPRAHQTAHLRAHQHHRRRRLRHQDHLQSFWPPSARRLVPQMGPQRSLLPLDAERRRTHHARAEREQGERRDVRRAEHPQLEPLRRRFVRVHSGEPREPRDPKRAHSRGVQADVRQDPRLSARVDLGRSSRKLELHRGVDPERDHNVEVRGHRDPQRDESRVLHRGHGPCLKPDRVLVPRQATPRQVRVHRSEPTRRSHAFHVPTPSGRARIDSTSQDRRSDRHHRQIRHPRPPEFARPALEVLHRLLHARPRVQLELCPEPHMELR